MSCCREFQNGGTRLLSETFVSQQTTSSAGFAGPERLYGIVGLRLGPPGGCWETFDLEDSQTLAHIVVCSQGEHYLCVHISTAQSPVLHIVDGPKCCCQDMLDREYLNRAFVSVLLCRCDIKIDESRGYVRNKVRI